MAKRVLVLLIAALFSVSLIQPIFAELAVVGPTNAENGFPAFYQDSNGVALEIGLDPLFNFADPVIAGNNFSEQIGFGDEAFWYLAEATLDMPASPALPTGGGALIVMAIEAAFGAGPPLDGDQFPFNRLRIRIDAPLAGTYRVIHPYGVDEFVVDTPGVNAVNSTVDIGGINPDFARALTGRIGPFLTAVNPAPPAGFIGNINILQTVTGSPFGTNYFRIQGPGGIDIQTDQFAISGKIFSGVVGTPVIVDRVTYEKELDHNAVDVMATSSPAAQVSISGLTPLPAPMVGNGTGKFYRHIHLNDTTVPLPPTVTVNAVNPPNAETSIIKNLVDIVQITRAEYNLALRTLTIEAVSGDEIAPPVLTATGFGNLVAGSLVVADVLVPPASVTVTSSAGGSDTRSVIVTGHAILPNTLPAAADDTVNTNLDTAAIINVLANDVDIDGAINPATLVITTAPLSGTALINPDSTITYTPGLGFIGQDAFNYTVQDDLGGISNIATVTVNVVNLPPAINTPPVAVDDVVVTNIGVPVVINLIANDTDADGTIDPVSVSVVTISGSGTLVNNLDGTVRYAPNAGFSGADSFTYNVRDNLGALSNTAAVNITVNPAETLAVTSAIFRQIGSRWIITGTDSLASPSVVITVSLERGGLLIGSGNVAADPLLPADVWTVDVRRSTVLPQAGDTVRVESSAGAVLRNVPVTIRR